VFFHRDLPRILSELRRGLRIVQNEAVGLAQARTAKPAGTIFFP
jgi:hypothetical protein